MAHGTGLHADVAWVRHPQSQAARRRRRWARGWARPAVRQQSSPDSPAPPEATHQSPSGHAAVPGRRSRLMHARPCPTRLAVGSDAGDELPGGRGRRRRGRSGRARRRVAAAAVAEGSQPISVLRRAVEDRLAHRKHRVLVLDPPGITWIEMLRLGVAGA